MDKKLYKKIMKHVCDNCCCADCPQTKKMKLQCIRDRKAIMLHDETYNGIRENYDTDLSVIECGGAI